MLRCVRTLAVFVLCAAHAQAAVDAAFGFPSQSADYGLALDGGSVQEARSAVRESIKREFQSSGGERLWVLDDYLSEEGLEVSRSYLMATSWWGFQLTDKAGKDQEAGGDGVPWGASINSEDFLKLPSGRELQMLATVYAMGLEKSKSEPGRGRGEVPFLLPYEVTYKVVRRGDLTRAHYGTAAEVDGDEVWTMAFVNDEWDAQHYGDVLLYDAGGDIVGGATPRLGRVLAWRPSLGYLCRPPSIAFSQGENMLLVKWSTNASKAQVQERRRRRDQAEIHAGIADGFPLRSAADLRAAESVDISEHEVLRRHAQTGKRVVAFDDLFGDDELMALRGYIMSHGKVFYDDSIDGYSDNVQWISGFEVNYFVQSKFWTIVKKVAQYVSEGDGDWYPYDVSCNIIRSYDHTRIHGDVRNEVDDEWTFLLYLSPMDVNDYGETAFFTTKTDKTEMVYQVRPRYGRSVIFEGLIPHSARPPSPIFKGPRYSFAVKMSKTPSRAIQNILYEKVSQGSGGESDGDAEPVDAEEYVRKLTKKHRGDATALNRSLVSFEKKVERTRKAMQENLMQQAAELEL